jgi:hypothetical protein
MRNQRFPAGTPDQEAVPVVPSVQTPPVTVYALTPESGP